MIIRQLPIDPFTYDTNLAIDEVYIVVNRFKSSWGQIPAGSNDLVNNEKKYSRECKSRKEIYDSGS